MTYFSVDPEVPGGLDSGTILDRSVHPPIVTRLHCYFDGWLGDDLLTSFPIYIVTESLGDKLLEADLTGFSIGDVEISRSELFDQMQPDTELPSFVWLQIDGKAGRDDFGLATGYDLIVSQRALDILKKFRLAYATISPYQG
jgi:hypothetical protein